MKATDVIGFTLGDARNMLENNNIRNYSIRVTSSPRLKCEGFDDDYRVVGLRTDPNNELELIICKPLLE